MPKQPISRQNQTLVRYISVLIVGVLIGRQWTLFTVDPHGVMPNAYDEDHANIQSLPKLQDPSAAAAAGNNNNNRIIRDLAVVEEGSIENANTPAESNPLVAEAPPIQQPKQEIPAQANIITTPEDEANAGSITSPLQDAETQDENNEDGGSNADDKDDSDGKDKEDGGEDSDEGNKDEETDAQPDEPKVDEPVESTKASDSVSTNPPISLETMAPKLIMDPPVVTHVPYVPNSDASAFGNETVDISEFQAEIDRRLPLWQAEAAKEDGMQDPPTVKVYDGIVLATKVHYVGRQSVNQMICMQKAAYNHRRNYPWVIFHTVPVTPKQAAEARAVAYPGTVTFVQDSPPLEEVVGNFTQEEQDYLINRCQCCHPKNPKDCCKYPNKKIDWGWWCYEKKTGWVTLSYAWQAVFRSYDIWTHPALKDKKFMVWIDDDAIPTKSWLKDPLKPMVEEDLVIFYDNFPAGFCKSGGIIEKMQLAYNHSYCYIHRIHVFKGPQTGKFVVRPCKKNKKGNYVLDKFGLVHGMMHITNLDVYRKPIHLNFQRLLTQHNTHPFSREWDDQIAVTVPAAFENPEKAWDMRMHGFNMSIHHNGKLDGKQKNKKWKYTTWWKYYKDEFPVAREMCDHLVKFGG